MVPGTIFLPVGLLLSGWAAQRHLSWVATDIVSTTPFSCYSLYRADYYNVIIRV